MTANGVVQPRITTLTHEQIEQVHDYSLRILESTGVRVDSERACRVLARGGCRADGGNRVSLPRELVEWALRAAPSTVDVYDRSGSFAFCLGDDRTRFGIGVTALYYQDPRTDDVVPFARRHMEATVRLGSALPEYDVISTVGIVQDVPALVSDLYGTLEMVANTTRPLVLLVSEESIFPAVLDLLEHLHGDLAARPFVIPYFNPVSPLIVNVGTADKMFASIERGLPFIYSNYGMAGATTPITPAGSLAVLNAELLAGLTLSQLVKEGTPVILGTLPTFFDMKGMESFYDSHSFVVNLACAEMMAHYGLPHAGTSGSGYGWGPDLLASGMFWMNHLTSCLGRVGLAPFVGDLLGSQAFSPALIVYAHEIVRQTRRLAAGFSLDEASVGLDEIARIGPGGNFLAAPMTRKLFRSAYYKSDIFPILGLKAWQSRGQPRAIDLLRDYTCDLMERMVAPPDHQVLLSRGEEWIKRRGVNV